MVANVRIVPDHSTDCSMTVGISSWMATKFGLIPGDQELREPASFKLKSYSLRVQLRPSPRNPTTHTQIIDIQVSELLVFPSLKQFQIVLNQKIQVIRDNLEFAIWDLKLIVMDKRSSRDLNLLGQPPTLPVLLKGALKYDLTQQEGLYWNARKWYKQLIKDLSTGAIEFSEFSNSINDFETEWITTGISEKFIQLLWEDILKYNYRYMKGNLIVRWLVWLKFEHLTGLEVEQCFCEADVAIIFEDILKRRSKWELETALDDKKLMRFLLPADYPNLVSTVRKANYFDSPRIASLFLEKFGEVYRLHWVLRDILKLVLLTSSKRQVTNTVRKFLEFYHQKWPDQLSQSWLKQYLNLIKLYSESSHFPDIQLNGHFVLYLSMLYKSFPAYFMQLKWTAFGEVQSRRESIFRDSKDSLLEMSRIIPFLMMRPLRPAGLDRYSLNLKHSIDGIRLFFERYRKMKDPKTSGVAMKNILISLEFHLHLTGFVDDLISRAEMSSENISGLTDHAKIAIILASEIIYCFHHYLRIQEMSLKTNLLVIISSMKLWRIGFILKWSRLVQIPLNHDEIRHIGHVDLYSLSAMLWVRSKYDSHLGVYLDQLQNIFSDTAEASALIATIKSAGEPFSMEAESKDLSIRWDMPPCLDDPEIDPDLALLLLRTFLFFKFGIPFGATRTGLSTIQYDLMQRHEYAEFLNFCLERYFSLMPESSSRIPMNFSVLIESEQNSNEYI